jgi:hypothetical protein
MCAVTRAGTRTRTRNLRRIRVADRGPGSSANLFFPAFRERRAPRAKRSHEQRCNPPKSPARRDFVMYVFFPGFVAFLLTFSHPKARGDTG